MPGETQIGCCVFLRRAPTLSRLGYRALPADGGYDSSPEEDSAVTVVVGKERRVFSVDPSVLEEAPFRVLMEVMREKRDEGRRDRKRSRRKDAIFVDVDAILFEHMLWMVYNDCSSSSSSTLFQLNLKEIIEFYSQDL